MTGHSRDSRGIAPGLSSSPCPAHTEGTPCQVTSVPLSTALRIAREQQRSKSSRRKIFREEPDRYLDIVQLMRDQEPELVYGDGRKS